MGDLRIDNTRVCVRVRPPDSQPRQLQNNDNEETCLRFSETELTVYTPLGEYPFVCDKVFGTGSSQIEMFRYCAVPLVEDVLNGYNATIMSFGQTGSGKTYTMTGNDRDASRVGIVPRSMRMLFENAETNATTVDFAFRFSFVEGRAGIMNVTPYCHPCRLFIPHHSPSFPRHLPPSHISIFPSSHLPHHPPLSVHGQSIRPSAIRTPPRHPIRLHPCPVFLII